MPHCGLVVCGNWCLTVVWLCVVTMFSHGLYTVVSVCGAANFISISLRCQQEVLSGAYEVTQASCDGCHGQEQGHTLAQRRLHTWSQPQGTSGLLGVTHICIPLYRQLQLDDWMVTWIFHDIVEIGYIIVQFCHMVLFAFWNLTIQLNMRVCVPEVDI